MRKSALRFVLVFLYSNVRGSFSVVKMTVRNKTADTTLKYVIVLPEKAKFGLEEKKRFSLS